MFFLKYSNSRWPKLPVTGSERTCSRSKVSDIAEYLRVDKLVGAHKVKACTTVCYSP